MMNEAPPGSFSLSCVRGLPLSEGHGSRMTSDCSNLRGQLSGKGRQDVPDEKVERLFLAVVRNTAVDPD